MTSGASLAVPASEVRDELLSPMHSESQLHQQLKYWTLLPVSHRDPAPPVMKYGALHLLRLFGMLFCSN